MIDRFHRLLDVVDSGKRGVLPCDKQDSFVALREEYLDLAPDLVKAAIEGRLPRGIGNTRLTDLPAEWSRHHKMLGLPSQYPPFEPNLRNSSLRCRENEFCRQR